MIMTDKSHNSNASLFLRRNLYIDLMTFNFRGQSDVFDNGSSGDNSEDSMFDIENLKRPELSIQHPRSNVHQDNDSHGLLIEQPFKGWKHPDMMFATRRSLSDACTSIAKQLENVYSSVSNIVGPPLSMGSTIGLEEKLDTIQKLLEQQQHFHDCI
ncbi:probable transcription factor KAN2 isoform X2 [Cornus florida]|uniref:probable transcription factor KAN2 isoform X2 n=1 Tax=Cornus florida TaxID=4283 RepID=UPI00289A60CE|nr:probable transcription factor KAN2 isoform X2 [Cornus florida]